LLEGLRTQLLDEAEHVEGLAPRGSGVVQAGDAGLEDPVGRGGGDLVVAARQASGYLLIHADEPLDVRDEARVEVIRLLVVGEHLPQRVKEQLIVGAVDDALGEGPGIAEHRNLSAIRTTGGQPSGAETLGRGEGRDGLTDQLL